MGKFIDETGNTYGELTVISLDKNRSNDGHKKWVCKCSCGNIVSIFSQALRRNNGTRHCGCKKIGKNIKDLTGIKYQNLLVLKLDHSEIYESKGRRYLKKYWLCQCLLCNSEKIILQGNLSKALACGCLVGTTKAKESTGINGIFYDYKKRALERNFEFQLSFEEFNLLITRKCYYCNCEPGNLRYWRNGKKRIIYQGIDRIDSSRGYTVENTVPCCFRCNRSKSNDDPQDFLSWIEKVYNHSIANKNS